MNGARWLAQALVVEGVETLFGYPGGTIMPFYDALHDAPGLKHVLVRHEQPSPPMAMRVPAGASVYASPPPARVRPTWSPGLPTRCWIQYPWW